MIMIIFLSEPGWQKLRGGTGPPPKGLDSDENFKPEHTLFFANKDLSQFTHFLEIFRQKKCLLGQKQCFLGKKCTITWYIVHILLS